MYKWILAAVGFFVLGKNFFGAMIGYFIGSFIDNMNAPKNSEGQQAAGGQGRRFTNDDVFKYYQQRTSNNTDFTTMLIALSASVMRADGKVLKAELDYVKEFFKRQFGPQFNSSHLQSLKQFIESDDIPLDEICRDIRARTQEEVRIQLLHYLFGIAKADGVVSEIEMRLLDRIATLLGIPRVDFESVKNMFYRDVNSDFKVLGLEQNASDEEVKKAYRQMAIRYHPDKVAQMGEEYQKGAKEKFQAIQNAYDNIKKTRGLK